MATQKNSTDSPRAIIGSRNSANTIPIIPGDCVLRFDEVRKKTRLCRAHCHALAAQGRFPKPLKLVSGGRASGWLLSEIETWIADRVAERDSGPRAA